MKCEIIIDPKTEEKIVVYAKQESALINEIKHLAEQQNDELLGYIDGEVKKLKPFEIYYITVSERKVYAVCENERYILKERLYLLEGKLPEFFVKINQSCLANIKKTDRFDTSISGTLKIYFKNGDSDFVSRRQLKTIKERLGI